MRINLGLGVRVVFFLSDATDNETPETGKAGTVDVYISKSGGAFAATTNSVTEIGRGWYYVALTTTEVDTLGPLILEAEVAGANVYREVHRVMHSAADAIMVDNDADALADLIADHVLRRNLDNVEASTDGDTQDLQSLYGAIATLVNDWAVSSNIMTIYETDGTTSIGTRTLTPSASADPIIGAATN